MTVEEINLNYSDLCKFLGKEKVEAITADWCELLDKHNLKYQPMITVDLFTHVQATVKLNDAP